MTSYEYCKKLIDLAKSAKLLHTHAPDSSSITFCTHGLLKMEIEDFKLAIEHVMEGKKHKMTINPKTITVELARPKARPKAKKPVEDIYDYSNNKNYWKRRNTVESLLQLAKQDEKIEELYSELTKLCEKINSKTKTRFYKCTYALRKGQKFERTDFGGGFCDTWYRSNHFMLPIEGENPQPPLKPITVILRDPGTSAEPEVMTEFICCVHPECIKRIGTRGSNVIQLLCPQHANKELVSDLAKFCSNQKRGSTEAKEIGKATIALFVDILEQRLSDMIMELRKIVKGVKSPKPDKVIEVNCYLFDEENMVEGTIYVDLIKCVEIDESEISSDSE